MCITSQAQTKSLYVHQPRNQRGAFHEPKLRVETTSSTELSKQNSQMECQNTIK
mgnify:CR=1 FL=1